MVRAFLILAAIGSVLLLASLITGFTTHNNPAALLAHRSMIHRFVSGATVLSVVSLHAFVFVYLRVTTNRCATLAGDPRRSDRIAAEAIRNRRRPYALMCGSTLLIALAAFSGPADAASSPIQSLFHIGLASFAVAFNFGTLLVEFASIVAQSRLLGEIRQ
jgi:hypothetical protein